MKQAWAPRSRRLPSVLATESAASAGIAHTIGSLTSRIAASRLCRGARHLAEIAALPLTL